MCGAMCGVAAPMADLLYRHTHTLVNFTQPETVPRPVPRPVPKSRLDGPEGARKGVGKGAGKGAKKGRATPQIAVEVPPEMFQAGAGGGGGGGADGGDGAGKGGGVYGGKEPFTPTKERVDGGGARGMTKKVAAAAPSLVNGSLAGVNELPRAWLLTAERVPKHICSVLVQLHPSHDTDIDTGMDGRTSTAASAAEEACEKGGGASGTVVASVAEKACEVVHALRRSGGVVIVASLMARADGTSCLSN
jgi:hypothetical protein